MSEFVESDYTTAEAGSEVQEAADTRRTTADGWAMDEELLRRAGHTDFRHTAISVDFASPHAGLLTVADLRAAVAVLGELPQVGADWGIELSKRADTVSLTLREVDARTCGAARSQVCMPVSSIASAAPSATSA